MSCMRMKGEQAAVISGCKRAREVRGEEEDGDWGAGKGRGSERTKGESQESSEVHG